MQWQYVLYILLNMDHINMGQIWVFYKLNEYYGNKPLNLPTMIYAKNCMNLFNR